MHNNLKRPDVSQFNLNMSSINPYYSEGARYDNTSEQTPDAAEDEFANEPPLLEDLGVDIAAIRSKLVSVLLFMKPNPEFVQKPDMTGPLLIGTLLGLFLAFVS